MILAVSLVIFCTIELSYGYKPGSEWRRNFKNVNSILGTRLGRHQDRFRRQFSPNCSRAINESQSQRFQNCFNTLDKLSDSDLTNDDLKVYCDDDCSSEIISVSTDLARYCDNGRGVSDLYVLLFAHIAVN